MQTLEFQSWPHYVAPEERPCGQAVMKKASSEDEKEKL